MVSGAMRFRVDKFEAFLILSSFLWGTSFVASKIGVGEVDPFLFALLRWLIAAPVLMLVAYLFADFDLSIFKDKILWLVGLLNAVGLFLQNAGMTNTSATNAVLLVDINVVFVAILASLILKEAITKFTIIGLLIGLLGVFIVSTGGDLGKMTDGSLVGNLLVFAAGIVWAFYIVYQKMAVDKHPDVLMMTSSVVVTTLIISIPIALVFTQSYALPASGFMAAAYVALVCTGGAFMLYIAGLRGKGATDSSIILLLEIVFAMLFAFLILGEVPDALTAAGAALIVSAIVLVSIQESNGRRKKAA
ncbi:MAG: DMT family transporter [Methanomassiliicoccales archaeon]|jgi:drug/metabolite transporter (DMT)-like permease|nr:DMT family transporter [Methanomassiliicoccales archaeon]MDD1756979.1 DMT family transporter [Methanomassiliicoccales archaeon]